MIVNINFLKRIKDFGLNSYEAKLWAALLSRGVSTAGELSDIAGVPRSRTYDVLESLEKKGFIMMKISKPIKYIAVPPSEVLERVKKKIKRDAEFNEKTLDDLRNSDIIKELTLLHSNGISTVDPLEITGIIKGRNNIYNHLDYLLKNAKDSVFFLGSEDGINRKFNNLKKTFKKLNEKGIKIKVAAPFTAKSSALIAELKKVADVKSTKLNGRLVLVDNKHITFMLSKDDDVHPSYDTAIWVNSEFFAKLLNNSFADKFEALK